MTTENRETDPTTEPTQATPTEPTAQAEIIDDDPMIVAMKQAEADIAETENGATTSQTTGGAPVSTPTADQKPAETGKSTQDIQVPKARLDAVLSERDVLKGQVEHYRTLATVREEMLKGNGQAPATQEPPAGQTTTAPAATYENLVEKAENDKLVAAQKYEDGDISLVDFKKIEIEADKQIRKLNEEHTVSLVEGVRTATTATITANNQQQVIEQEAVKIQEQAPYVAAIDALPAKIRDGIWQEINAEAIAKLAAKGINPQDGTTASKLELIREKAALTNIYGPRYAGTIAASVTSQSATAKPAVTADQRAAKLDLASLQPPDIAAAGTSTASSEMTETDVMNMTDDQIADMLKKAPGLVQRAVGLTTL